MSELPPISQKYGLDSTDFKSGIAAMNRELRVLDSAFKASAAALGDWESSTSGLESHIDSLNRKIEVQKDKVAALQAEYKRVAAEQGDSSRAAKEMEIRLNKETEALNKMESALAGSQTKLRGLGDATGDAGKKTDDLRGSSDRLEGGLKGLKSAVDRLGGAFRTAITHIGSFGKKIASVAVSAAKAVGRLALNVAKFAAAAAGLAAVALGGFLASTIGPASDLAETISKVGVVFGEAAGPIQEFAENAATALGQSQQAALDAAATFGVFGKAAGLTGSDLSDFSIDLVGLASDMASFSNTSPEDAVIALSSALRGESEPIRAYGVLLDDATLKAKAMELGIISTTTEALTPAQKVLAAYNVILDQTTDAQGDFERTSGGLANQQRIANAQWADAKTVIGTGLLPLATQLFRVFNEFLSSPAVKAGIQEFADKLANMGKSIGEMLDRAKAGGGLSSIFAGITGGESFNFEAIGERISTFLSGLIQKLISSRVQLIGMGLQLLQGLAQGIQEALPTLLPAALGIINGLLQFLVTGLPDLLSAGLQILTTLIGAITENLPMIMQTGVEIILGLLDALITNLPMIVEAGIQAIVTLADGISQAMPQLIPAIVEAILTIVEIIIENLPMLIEAGTKLLVALIEGIAAALPILIEKGPEIIQALYDAMIEVLPILGDAALEILKTIAGAIVANLPQMAEAGGKIMLSLIDATKRMAQQIYQVGKDIVLGIWQGIQDNAGWFGSQVRAFFENIVNGVKSVLGIQSPSKVFAGIGENAGLGYIEGLGDALDRGRKSLQMAFGETALNLTAQAPALSPALATAGAGGQLGAITINLYGVPGDPAKVARAAGNGVLAALRSKGVK